MTCSGCCVVAAAMVVHYVTDLASPHASLRVVVHIHPSHTIYIAGISIGRTMFETDRLPDGWVERLNNMDYIRVCGSGGVCVNVERAACGFDC